MPGEVPKSVESKPLTEIPNSPCLLPYAIDHRSYNDAERVAITYPNPGTGRYVDVPWAQFGAAVDAAAWAFDAKIGARRSSSESDKVVAILARSDAAYMITIYALHKCGLVPLLISTRNSRAAIVNLLKLTNAVAVLTDSYNRSEAEASAAEAGRVPVYNLAPLPGTVSVADRKPFPFSLKWDEECDRKALILHTSGSTGLPKPVAWNTRFFWHQGYYPPQFVAKYNNSSVLATLPLFHGSGVALTRASLLWLGWKVTFPDPSKPVTASGIIDICNSSAVSGPDIVIGAPSVIEEIPSLPGGLDVLHGRKFWFFVGAPVPPHFGGFLVKEGTHFLSMLGSTEIGQMNVLEPDGRLPQDWQYHEIRPDLDIVLEPRGSTPDGGPFELIILAKDGWRPGTINVNINGVEGYSTSDLYQRHPTHPRLLKHSGRADDVVVLSNGEKTLSRAIEVPIEADSRVSAVIVFGTGRTQNGILVAPSSDHVFDPSDETKLAEFRNAIWPSVEKANKTSPQHSQIWKEMILVTTPGKELPRTDKGSVKRKAAIDLYAKEIDELYLAVESLSSSNKPSLPEPAEEGTLGTFFEAIIEEAMGKPIGLEDDVFEQGMDSLKAIFVRNSLLSACRRSEKQEVQELASKVPQNFVFLYSSPKAMATAMASLVQSGFLADSGMETAEQHAQVINDMITKYTSDLPTQQRNSLPTDVDEDETVILTGSTGSLGTFILHTLLLNPRVKQVFAFNRAGSAPSLQRQRRSYKERHLDEFVLDAAASSGKLVFHDVQVNQPEFGLPHDVYSSIHSSATLIIHNAWALNFNWSLATFEPVHIKGLRNIVDFALTSPRNTSPRIAFTSSIASAGAYTKGPVPEEALDDPSICLPQGYARSKYVSERILAIARQKTGLSTMSFRIGQISGDSQAGIWNVTDNVPALVRGCQELGAIPVDWLPVVAWIPVDSVARTIVDVCTDRQRRAGMFHIANPQPTPWSELVPVLQRSLKTQDGKESQLMKMREWIDRLNDGSQSPESNPAVKLIAFFESNIAGRGIRCRLDLKKTMEVSETLRAVSPVDKKAFETYLDYWKSVSYLRR